MLDIENKEKEIKALDNKIINRCKYYQYNQYKNSIK